MEEITKGQLELINQQIKELVGVYRGAVFNSGISDNEFWIWYALIIMGGEYSQQDICGLWSFSKQTVNTIIIRMVQEGYAYLEVVPGTRNRKIIRLTEDGRMHGEKLVMPIFNAERRAVERIPAEDIKICFGVFSKYISVLKEELNENEK